VIAPGMHEDADQERRRAERWRDSPEGRTGCRTERGGATTRESAAVIAPEMHEDADQKRPRAEKWRDNPEGRTGCRTERGGATTRGAKS